MTDWRETTIAELASPGRYSLATGPFGSAISSKHFLEEGIPVLRGSNLSLDVGTRIDDRALAFLSVEKAATFERSLARNGDLVFTCWGTIGQVGLIDGRSKFDRYVVSNKQMKLTPDPVKADSLFLYYLLSSPMMVGTVQGQAIGSAVPGFNLGQLRELRLRVPPIEVQHRIADVLGTLDDLIEHNRLRIDLLEKMTQAIYREWFVHFRFPGHADCILVDSVVDPLPEGWSIRTLADVADARRGLSWSRSSETDSSLGTRVVTIPNIGRRLHFVGCTRLADVSPRDVDRFSLRQGDILMIGSNGNPARVGQSVRVPWDSDGVFASFIMRVRADPTKTSPTLLFHQLGDGGGVVESMRASAVGSTDLRNVRISALREAEIVVPDIHVMRDFDEAVGPAQAMADLLNQECTQLIAIRDFLLPRLVSGQIDVSDLDLDAGAVSVA